MDKTQLERLGMTASTDLDERAAAGLMQGGFLQQPVYSPGDAKGCEAFWKSIVAQPKRRPQTPEATPAPQEPITASMVAKEPPAIHE
eukprot:156060-Alexandrium_andersonii.AAC.1